MEPEITIMNEPVSGETMPEGIMSDILKKTNALPNPGDLVEGTVLSVSKSAVYIDLGTAHTGIIYGKEYMDARDLIKKMAIGDPITAKVIETENPDGYMELSLQEARRALMWSTAEALIKNKTILELPVKEANKGGLILEWQGIAGFLPASQLKPEHYPRVDDGNKTAVLEKLKRLVGEKIEVSIMAIDPQGGKLIFSEKDGNQKERQEIISKYAVGDVISGEVTGMVDFGVFVKIEPGLEGLVHISEIHWGLVEDPKKVFKVGERVKAKIIEMKDGKISLSIKALKENPWNATKEKYKKDDIVKGVVIKFNQYGALVSIEEGVAGLAHISEFESPEKLRETLELGKTYSFKITLFSPDEQKMTLSFVKDEGKK